MKNMDKTTNTPERDTFTASGPTAETRREQRRGERKRRRRKKILAFTVSMMAAALCVCAILCFLPGPMQDAPDPAIQELIDNGTLVDTVPDNLWAEDPYAEGHGFTPRAMLGDDVDSIGVLTIDKIGVSVQVYDSENTMEDMKKGASHYRLSSYWDGNIAMAAHIGNASYSYFERLRELKAGDILEYETTLGVRQYKVDDIRTISDEDWSVIDRTQENRLTLTTCVDGREDVRLCVRAIEAV